ncbi:MAG: hypothetical protein HY042_01355, partial [Spirochaetia bacterium]|nr:hypothetical protein [Spirochaetia bacterium]
MPLDPAKPVQQAKIPAGTVLFEAGQKATMLCLVHDGEIAAASRFSRNAVRRLYNLGANTSPGFGAVLMSEEYPTRIVATKDSVISAFPVRGAFTALILGKLNVGMLAVRSLLNEVALTRQAIQKCGSFLGQIQKSSDNLSLAYYRANPGTFKAEVTAPGAGIAIDPVLPAAKVLVQHFQENGGEIPEPI